MDVNAFKETDVPKPGLASRAVGGAPVLSAFSAEETEKVGEPCGANATAAAASRQAVTMRGCVAVLSPERQQVRSSSLVQSLRNTSDSMRQAGQARRRHCTEDSG